VRGEEAVRFADATGDEALSISPGFSALVEASGMRSGVTVALRKDDILRGTVTVWRQEVRPFTDKQIALLQNFAAQAVIAMDNARLINEAREALEQQTATAEVLQVINSSPGDLAPVFDAMLEKATRLCAGVQGALWNIVGDGVRLAATYGLPAEYVELLRQQEHPDIGPNSLLQQIMRGERVVHVLDLAQRESYKAREPLAVATVERFKTRTAILVALIKEGAPVGAFSIARREIRPFTEKQIALLQNFAAQAIIAMENARLLGETREALQQQTATAEVLQVINASPGDLAPVFDAILEKALELCGGDFGYLQTYEGERFLPVAWRGLPPRFAEYMPRMDQPGPSTSYARILAGAPFVHVTDLQEGDAYRTSPLRRALIELGGARTSILIALRRDDTLLGTLVIYRQEVRAFSDKEIALLQNFAAQAVIAMENARLITETREALEQQTATAEVLGVINSSPGDLAPVFDAVLEKALRLCGADFGNLWISDGDLIRSAAIRGAPPAYAEFVRQPLKPEQAPVLARAMRERSILHFPDMEQGEPYRQGVPLAVATHQLGGVRSLLIVPLAKDEASLGMFAIYRQEVRPFADKQIVLLENFAAQAVIAMENARLLGELRQRTEEVAELNRGLEARVAEQVEELGRVGRLKRFLAPQLAELIVSQGDEKVLESHRREIVVVFCDLRGYTAFTETAEPEEVLDFLREYHGALGPLVAEYEGTLDQFSGDGIMVFFNDPVPCPDPAERAVKMAIAMREAAGALITSWRRRGRVLGFGAGIAQGYATLGQIGFADRSGYTAIGTVCNLAARLCAEAKDGQILVAQRVAVSVEATTPLEEVGELTLKGLTQPIVAYNVPLAAIQPALRVIEGGPQSF
jgi:GAF domain-containing protein